VGKEKIEKGGGYKGGEEGVEDKQYDDRNK